MKGIHKAECSRCGQVKEIERIGKQSYCRECKREWQRLYMRERRRKEREARHGR